MLALALLVGGCHASNENAGNSTTGPVRPADSVCSEAGGAWDAKSGRCTLSKVGANGAQVEVTASYPVDLMDNPTAGPVLGPFVRKFFTDHGQADSGAGNAKLAYQVFTHNPTTKTVLFHADWYFSSMPHPNGELTTFTFDFEQGKQLQLADLFCPGTDPLKAVPPIARPFVQRALTGSPFHVEQFEPGQAGQAGGELADNYQAWALDADDLVLYLPSARGPGGVPPGFITPHIPLTEFSAISRGKGCPAAAAQPR